jgi:hypothetical protein
MRIYNFKFNQFNNKTKIKLIFLIFSKVLPRIWTVVATGMKSGHIQAVFNAVLVSIRVTRWVCEKIAQNLAKPIFGQN